jgi:hypothetical protein
MMKKLCVTTGIVAAAAGLTLISAPAYADTNAGNSSSNTDTTQSGNNFGDVTTSNVSGVDTTNLNNVNGVAVTATDGSHAGSDVNA